MTFSFVLLIKILAAGLIVGFVTASIKSWVDRVFLVILLTGLAGLPIHQSISINLIVVALAALMLTLRQTQVLHSVRQDWAVLVLPAVLGGIVGRLLGLQLSAPILMLILGIYALLAGLRLLLVKPMPEREDKVHAAWLSPVAFLFGGFTGLISAGGKPFAVPIYNWIMGHHPQRAYALASVSVATSAWSAVFTQTATGRTFLPFEMALAVFAFVIITLTALAVDRFWSPKLNRIVMLLISPLLMFVGIRFILAGLKG